MAGGSLLQRAAVVLLICLCNIASGEVWSMINSVSKSATVEKLVKDYDRGIRPNGPKPLKVSVSLYFEYTKWHDNKLDVYLYFRQRWNDQRFIRQGNVTRFNSDLLLGHIWEPDTYAISALKPEVIETGLINIDNNGDILWSYAVQFSVPCAADSKKSGPVSCTIAFQSYTYDANDVTYTWTDQPTFSNVTDKVVSFETKETKNKYSIGNWSGVELNLKVQPNS